MGEAISLDHLSKITLFAIYYLWSIGSISGFKFIGARFFAVEVFNCIFIETICGAPTSAHTLSFPEF